MLSAIRMPVVNDIGQYHDLYRRTLSHGNAEMSFVSASKNKVLKRPGTASVCSSSRAGWDATASSFGGV